MRPETMCHSVVVTSGAGLSGSLVGPYLCPCPAPRGRRLLNTRFVLYILFLAG
jgi:hypothetical protein